MSTATTPDALAPPRLVMTAGGRPVPGSRAPGWVQTADFLRSPTSFLERNRRRYGDIFSARLHGLATGRMVMVADPKLIEEVFKADPYMLKAGEAAYTTIAPIGGPNSLLVLDAPEHLEDRRLLLPPLHGERLRAYADVIAEETDRSVATWPIGTPFPMRRPMADITLDVIMRAVFGLERGGRYDALRQALVDSTSGETAISLGLMVPAFRRDLGPFRAWSEFEAAVARTDALLYAEIADRRKTDDLEQRPDILSMLILARRKNGTPMTDHELRDELVTLLLAGHETTATGLSWTMELLYRHPAVLAKLRASVAAGDEEYLDAVIHEALRVRPVIPFVFRVLTRPIQLGGYALDAGVTVVPAVHLVHRREDLYPRSAEFRPERFLGRSPGTYEWLPFGGGTRRCIGASFALMEMRVVLQRVLAQTMLEPAGKRPEKTRRRAFTLVPARGAMTIRRR